MRTLELAAVVCVATCNGWKPTSNLKPLCFCSATIQAHSSLSNAVHGGCLVSPKCCPEALARHILQGQQPESGFLHVGFSIGGDPFSPHQHTHSLNYGHFGRESSQVLQAPLRSVLDKQNTQESLGWILSSSILKLAYDQEVPSLGATPGNPVLITC